MELFVKITIGKFFNASRDKRELSVIKDFDIPIVIIAKGNKNGIIEIDGFTVHCLTTKPIAKIISSYGINRFIALFTWALYIRKLNARYLSCHNLIALLIGWLSSLWLAKEKRPLLIYDSHEFEAGLDADGQRGKFQTWLVVRLERYLIKKTSLNLMVNDTIAIEVQKLHNLKQKPIVVRNIPSTWQIDDAICAKQRKEFCQQLKAPDNIFLVMYHGGISRNRGIENLLKAVALLDNVAVVLLGNGEHDYILELESLVETLQIQNKIIVHQAVPLTILWQYVGASDVGVSILLNSCLNHYYALPNKIFENIQSLTPIIGSNFPEIIKIVDGYQIGICCDPSDPKMIAQSITLMRNDTNRYAIYKRNLIRAKNELCWDQESQVLINAYKSIF